MKDEADDIPIIESDLVETYYDDKLYLLHKESNELFDVYKSGKKGNQRMVLSVTG